MAVLSQEEMESRSATIRGAGKTVVFTNGCFDLVHRGHVELLKRAKGEGDYLFVGINGDRSVRRLKGEDRPVQSEEDRAEIIDALAAVDDVTIFHEDTPEKLIKRVKPDVLVKGADYEEHVIVGATDVRSWEGRIVTFPLVEGRGTRLLLERIVARSRGKNA
ncbi:MAG: adenylyltransferase/cytidyltransferase family protein [Fidelibacterota bacterium]